MNKKKIIIIVCVIITLIAVIGGIIAVVKNKKQPETPTNPPVKESQIKNVVDFVGELDDGTKVNTNAKFNTPSTFGDFSIDNVRLTMKNGVTTFRVTATNNGETKTELKEITLILIDENGEELVKAKGLINETSPGESQEISIAMTSDYIHAYGYKITEN